MVQTEEKGLFGDNLRGDVDVSKDVSVDVSVDVLGTRWTFLSSANGPV